MGQDFCNRLGRRWLDMLRKCKVDTDFKKYNIEVIDVSTGGAVAHQQIPESENYQVPFANRIKTETGMITGAVGLINNAQQAETILQNKEANFVSVARGFLQNPHLVYEFASQLNIAIHWPPQYERGKESF